MQEQNAPGNGPLSIDVVSDVVCPWCYIGKRQLDDALATWAARHPDEPAPTVGWHPFQLNPAMPAEGMPRRDYLLAKFGSPEGGPGYGRVVAAAAAAGLVLHPERIQRQPNTLRAHALVRHAQGAQQHALAGALFRAYFVDGVDIGDPQALRRIALEQGLDDEAVDAALAEPSLQETAQVDEHLRDQGIGGVPFFVIGNRVAVSGAQGTDALLQALERASAQP